MGFNSYGWRIGCEVVALFWQNLVEFGLTFPAGMELGEIRIRVRAKSDIGAVTKKIT